MIQVNAADLARSITLLEELKEEHIRLAKIEEVARIYLAEMMNESHSVRAANARNRLYQLIRTRP